MTEPTDRPGSPGEGFAGRGSGQGGIVPGDSRVSNALTQLRIITGALASSIVVYAVVAWVVTGGGGGATGEEAVELGLPIVAVLAGMGVLNLLLAPAIERALLGSATGQPLEKVLSDYRKAKIVGFAFREASAVFGLMIALFTGKPSWCYALSAAALVAMALGWPSREGVERAARGAVQPE